MELFSAIYAGNGEKKQIHKNSADQRNQKESMLILTDSKSVRTVMKKISEDGYHGIAPHGIILLDKNRTGEQIDGIPVVASAENAVEYLCQNWVDRVIEVCEKEERQQRIFSGTVRKWELRFTGHCRNAF